MGRTVLVDPGVGSEAAAVGTVAWAQNVRLHMQGQVKDLSSAPERMQSYVDLVTQHRAWTLMNKPNGSFFTTWEEFCEHPQPWGLGKPWNEFRPILEAAIGKKQVQLAVVPDAKDPVPPPPGPGRGHKAEPKATPDERGSLSVPGHTQEEYLRAINRAPDAVKDLYRSDLIGQKEAAKLGPKNPAPHLAAQVAEVAQTAVAVVKASPVPKTEPEKRAVARKVNETVRKGMGAEVDEAAKLSRAVLKLDIPSRFRVWEAIADKHPDELIEVLKKGGHL